MFLYGLLGTTYIIFYYLCVVYNNLIVKYQLCLNKLFSVSVSVSVLFLCEHWLKPSELYETNNMFREQDLWCNLKSSVPADEILIGRPFGGVGFVCRKLKHCTIK